MHDPTWLTALCSAVRAAPLDVSSAARAAACWDAAAGPEGDEVADGDAADGDGEEAAGDGVAAAGWAGADRPDKATPDTTAAATTTAAPAARTGPRGRMRRADGSGSGSPRPSAGPGSSPASGSGSGSGRAGRARASFAAGCAWLRVVRGGLRVSRDGLRLFRRGLRVFRAGPGPQDDASRPGAIGGAYAARRGRRRVSRFARPQAQRGPQFLGEPAAARVAVGRVLGQRGGQHRVDRRGYCGAPCASGRRIRVDMRVHQGGALVGTERRRAAQELEPGARQRVEIRPAVEGTALDLLGCQVVEHAAGLIRRDDLAGREGLAHPEVGEVRAAARGRIRRVVVIEEDVGRPDVTVDQAARVRGVKRRRDLGDDLPGIAERKRAVPAEQRPCVPAGHVAHGGVQRPVRLVRVEDGNYVRVVKRGGRPRLADHPGPEAGVARQFRRQHLERDPAALPPVMGEVDDGLAALPDDPVQPVAGDGAGLPSGGQRRAGRVAHRAATGPGAIGQPAGPARPAGSAGHPIQ